MFIADLYFDKQTFNFTETKLTQQKIFIAVLKYIVGFVMLVP
jgi:hypothetical protein